MEESTTYQYILEKGYLRGLRKLVLRLGRAKFRTEPDPAVVARIEAIAEPGELDRLAERVLFVNQWHELFDAP